MRAKQNKTDFARKFGLLPDYLAEKIDSLDRAVKRELNRRLQEYHRPGGNTNSHIVQIFSLLLDWFTIKQSLTITGCLTGTPNLSTKLQDRDLRAKIRDYISEARIYATPAELHRISKYNRSIKLIRDKQKKREKNR